MRRNRVRKLPLPRIGDGKGFCPFYFLIVLLEFLRFIDILLAFFSRRKYNDMGKRSCF